MTRVSADGGARRASPTVAGLIATAPATDLLPPPVRPGRTIILTSGTTGSPKGARRPIPAAIRKHDCRTLLAVPVMLQRLLDAVPAAPFPSSLKIAASSGSALPAPLVPRFMGAFGDVLYNLYGSTEAGSATIATPAELRAHPTCAGRPSPGTRVLILDRNDNPLPPASIGRIFVGGEMIFEGYTNGDTVREYVRRTMARFSVPREVYFVAELPRNATGRVMHRYPKAPSGAPYLNTPPGTGNRPLPMQADPAARYDRSNGAMHVRYIVDRRTRP